MTNRDAINLLEEVKILDDTMYAYNPRYLEALDMALTALEAEETWYTTHEYPPKPQWIPCSERLPEEENKYLCTCSSDDEMFVLSFHKNLYAYDRYVFEQYKGTVHPGFIIYDSIYGDIEVDVLAWMPLPESYSGE